MCCVIPYHMPIPSDGVFGIPFDIDGVVTKLLTEDLYFHKKHCKLCCSAFSVEPLGGFEPPTYSFTSTPISPNHRHIGGLDCILSVSRFPCQSFGRIYYA